MIFTALKEYLADPKSSFLNLYVKEVNYFKMLWKEYPNDEEICKLVYMFLLRMRHDIPHVFALTAEIDFPGWEDTFKNWDISGMKDLEGFLWLSPKPCGNFDMKDRYMKGRH